jgi:hypothetical protein
LKLLVAGLAFFLLLALASAPIPALTFAAGLLTHHHHPSIQA